MSNVKLTIYGIEIDNLGRGIYGSFSPWMLFWYEDTAEWYSNKVWDQKKEVCSFEINATRILVPFSGGHPSQTLKRSLEKEKHIKIITPEGTVRLSLFYTHQTMNLAENTRVRETHPLNISERSGELVSKLHSRLKLPTYWPDATLQNKRESLLTGEWGLKTYNDALGSDSGRPHQKILDCVSGEELWSEKLDHNGIYAPPTIAAYAVTLLDGSQAQCYVHSAGYTEGYAFDIAWSRAEMAEILDDWAYNLEFPGIQQVLERISP